MTFSFRKAQFLKIETVAYSEPSQTSKMKHFVKKSPSYMFDRVQNTLLRDTVISMQTQVTRVFWSSMMSSMSNLL